MYTKVKCIVIFLQNGRTALYVASGKGHRHFVKLLLQQRADADIAKEV